MKGERQVWDCDYCGKPTVIYWTDPYYPAPALVICKNCSRSKRNCAGY